MVSFNVVSEIAIVPDKECSTPSLTGSAHSASAIDVDPINATVAQVANLLKYFITYPLLALREPVLKCTFAISPNTIDKGRSSFCCGRRAAGSILQDSPPCGDFAVKACGNDAYAIGKLASQNSAARTDVG